MGRGTAGLPKGLKDTFIRLAFWGGLAFGKGWTLRFPQKTNAGNSFCVDSFVERYIHKSPGKSTRFFLIFPTTCFFKELNCGNETPNPRWKWSEGSDFPGFITPRFRETRIVVFKGRTFSHPNRSVGLLGLKDDTSISSNLPTNKTTLKWWICFVSIHFL